MKTAFTVVGITQSGTKSNLKTRECLPLISSMSGKDSSGAFGVRGVLCFVFEVVPE